MTVQATPLASVWSDFASSVSAGMSIVCASAKASAASERMRSERRGCGRGIARQASEADPAVRFVTRHKHALSASPSACLGAPVRQSPSRCTSMSRGAEQESRERGSERPAAAAVRYRPRSRCTGKIGNRAFGRLISRTPEDSVELLEPAIMGAHVNVEQIGRTLLPYSQDQESFDKVAEAYETKTEVPLQQALEKHVPPGEMDEINKRVPWRGFPPPKAEGAGGGGAAPDVSPRAAEVSMPA